jgi:hypothetical protein
LALRQKSGGLVQMELYFTLFVIGGLLILAIKSIFGKGHEVRPNVVGDEPVAAARPPKTKKSQQSNQSAPSRRGVLDIVEFSYRDEHGAITKRIVEVRTGIRGHLFKGFCHLRQDKRSFSYRRILGDVVRVETGEILPAKEWWRQMRKMKRAA